MWYSGSSTASRKDSCANIPEYRAIDNSPSEPEPTTPDSPSEVKLGPGQIRPRGFRLAAGRYGELKLGLLMTKGQLEVDVVCARGLAQRYSSDNAPDTYVKCYLRDGDRWLQKRKTRV